MDKQAASHKRRIARHFRGNRRVSPTSRAALHDADVRVFIVNPAQVRNFAFGLAIRNKTDDMDSFVLARYGALVQPQIWISPSQEVRTLQALLKRREAIVQDLIRENNRLEKADSTDTPALIRKSITDSIEFLKAQLAKIQKDITNAS